MFAICSLLQAKKKVTVVGYRFAFLAVDINHNFH